VADGASGRSRCEGSKNRFLIRGLRVLAWAVSGGAVPKVSNRSS